MGARMIMPLRMLLPCLTVCLVASAAAVIGVASASAAGAYLTRAADGAVRACAASVLSHSLMAMPGSGSALDRAMPGACRIQLRGADGRMLIPAAPAAPGGRWSTATMVVRYQPQRMLYVYGSDDLRYVISGPGGPGASGTLLVMTPLAGTGRAVTGYAAAVGAVLVLLAAGAFALTRAILRPLREATGLAGTAGGSALGRLEEVTARVEVLAHRDHGRCSTAMARMRERLQASCADEAASRRSAADMSRQLGQACLQLRRQASILHGLTEYCRQPNRPSPASLDQMVRCFTDEITRMEALTDGLRACSANDPAEQDHQPDPLALRPVRLGKRGAYIPGVLGGSPTSNRRMAPLARRRMTDTLRCMIAQGAL